MRRAGLRLGLAALSAVCASAEVHAGAFLLPEGHGQFIAGVGYSRH